MKTTTYVNDLSVLVFRSIRNTSEWYRNSFVEANMASGKFPNLSKRSANSHVGFLEWVRCEIEFFADLVKRQGNSLYSLVDFDLINLFFYQFHMFHLS